MNENRPDRRDNEVMQALRRFTPARIALGRAGSAVPTSALLAFGFAQAQARDAVHASGRDEDLLEALTSERISVVRVQSAARDRAQYLQRPDLGRRLQESDKLVLQEFARRNSGSSSEMVFVLADGLSPVARMRHGLPLLRILWESMPAWRSCPVVVADLARVALGDEIGELLAARQLAMLIGERPGLSAPDSLGIYLTHAPRVGSTDAQRNCISNIRPEGFDYESAARQFLALSEGARRLGCTGVNLKIQASLDR